MLKEFFFFSHSPYIQVLNFVQVFERKEKTYTQLIHELVYVRKYTVFTIDTYCELKFYAKFIRRFWHMLWEFSPDFDRIINSARQQSFLSFWY